jgi:branched-subunit amino acid ABC-type transport system permease component
VTLVIFQALINGLLLGGVYLLAALGLNLVFGTLRIVNLAHGDFLMLGAYAAFVSITTLAVNPVVAIGLSLVVGLLLSAVVYLGIIDRIRNAEETSWILVTFGLSATIVGLVRFFLGPTPRFLNLYSGSLFVGPFYFSYSRLVAFATAILFSVALAFLLARTRMGKAVKATSQNPELARAMGLPVRLLTATAFAVGTALTFVGGSLLISVYAVDPEVGGGITFKSFAILAIAGLGRTTMVGLVSLALGAGEALLTLYIPATAADLLAFVVLLVVIFVRPNEVFKTRGLAQ